MNKMALKLVRIARSIPGFWSVIILSWKLIGPLMFRVSYRNKSRQGTVCLHVGAGNASIDGWLNTDILPPHLYMDMSQRLPIRDNSVAYIFGEHVIVYISRQAALEFFKESFRVLKPGGVLRIVTADIEALSRTYIDDPESANLLNERNRGRGYQYTSYPIDILNKQFFEDNNLKVGIRLHCEYDFQTLEQMFIIAGFGDIVRCKIGESRHAALSGIEQHDVGSIADKFTCVIEGTKLAL